MTPKPTIDPDPMTARQEWRAFWPMVLAAWIGIGLPIMPFNAIGLFISPLSAEFGWSRTMVVAGTSLAALVAIPMSPLLGAVVDKWGSRLLILPGIVLVSTSIAAFSLANGSTTQWMVLWGVFAFVAMMLKATVWTYAIIRAFSAGRSLALAVTLTGPALGLIVVPPAAQMLIDNLGWREAFVYLSVGWAVPAFVLAVFFIRDAGVRRAGDAGRPGSVAKDPSELPGLTVRQALRSVPLHRIALSTLLILLLAGTLIVHKVPMLEDAGVTRETAALLASLAGVASVAGTLTSGWLMTKFDAGLIGGLTNILLAVALIPLLEPFRTPTLIVIGMIAVGYASGTKMQVCSYLTSLYGGVRNYGKIYGVMASIFAVTGAIGPLLGGVLYDLTGSYSLLIILGIPIGLVSGVLLFRLGPAPDFADAPAPDPARATGDPAPAT